MISYFIGCVKILKGLFQTAHVINKPISYVLLRSYALFEVSQFTYWCTIYCCHNIFWVLIEINSKKYPSKVSMTPVVAMSPAVQLSSSKFFRRLCLWSLIFFSNKIQIQIVGIIKLITVKTVCFNQSSRLNVCQHMTCLIPRGQDLFQHVFRKEVSIIYSLRNQIWWVKQCISKVLFRKNCIVSIPFIGYWPPHFNPEEILGNICFWNPHYNQPL